VITEPDIYFDRSWQARLHAREVFTVRTEVAGTAGLLLWQPCQTAGTTTAQLPPDVAVRPFAWGSLPPIGVGIHGKPFSGHIIER
jgi:hypothetical protein